MSYTKQTWNTGDTITADKLNHMEDGIMESGESGAFIINVIDDGATWTLDKTWQEIYDAHSSGVVCVIKYTSEEPGNIRQISYSVSVVDGQLYTGYTSFVVGVYDNQFSTTSPNERPIVSFE